jgi:hypothetical protein
MIFCVCVWRDLFTRCVCEEFTLKNSETSSSQIKKKRVKRSLNSTVAPFLSDETDAELRGNNQFFSLKQNYAHVLWIHNYVWH